MKPILPLVLAAFIPLAALANDEPESDPGIVILPSGDSDLSEYRWEKRPIVVFADSPDDPRFAEQIELLNQGLDVLAERDVVILTDTNPIDPSPLRLKLRPRGFMLALVGKDGKVKLRKPLPWTVRELTRSIDKMPSRQREIEKRR